MNKFLLLAATAATSLLPQAAQAEDHSMHHHNHAAMVGHEGSSAHHHNHASNTPASIMSDHTHGKGAWMLSYRPMYMKMKGNRDGTNSLSVDEISGDFPSVTGGTLRVVPTEMTMQMHMLSAMYAPTDRLTLMLMGSYQKKDMDLTTFAMGNPNTKLGDFSTRSQGWGDTKISALYQLAPEKPYSLVGKLGLSLPTGSTDEESDVLTPMNTIAHLRMPYSMQLGSGTYDLEPALTYTQHDDVYSWGAQYSGVLRTGRNNNGYTLGDKHRVSAWGGYQVNSWLGSTLRLSGEYEQKSMDGIHKLPRLYKRRFPIITAVNALKWDWVLILNRLAIAIISWA